MRHRFFKLALYFGISGALAGSFWFSQGIRVSHYLGLLALLVGATVVIRLAQIYLYLYLFFANMRTGVPRLIANMFTLVFAILVFGWIASNAFGLRLAPLLATSAIFSVILGLALQDTLGNLFSGVALQIDHPFGIGDWVEIQNGGQKWVGQIHEVTWRGTTLVGFSDELISIPNRTIAQSQVVIFSHRQKPPRKSHTFRFPFDTPIDAAKKALLRSLEGIPNVLQNPPASVLLIEVSESWIVLKLFYSIADFGIQYRTGDRVQMAALESIQKAGLSLAYPSLFVKTSAALESSPSTLASTLASTLDESVV
jgi:small-conductance mechanosensitive channel